MKKPTIRYLVLVGLIASIAACGGGDGDEVVAGDWCRLTIDVTRQADHGGAALPYDLIDEWIETAPDEIAPSTERAGIHLRELPTDPSPTELVEARAAIDDFAEDHCQ